MSLKCDLGFLWVTPNLFFEDFQLAESFFPDVKKRVNDFLVLLQLFMVLEDFCLVRFDLCLEVLQIDLAR